MWCFPEAVQGVYIETVRDLTPVFEERDRRQSVYQTGAFLITFVMGGLMLGILYLVMGNTRKLSRTVRSFAMGQYDVAGEYPFQG